MKLQNKIIQTVFEAHAALDGSDRVAEKAGGVDTDKVIRVPYKFGGAARLTIARNLRLLKDAFEDYDKARQGLVKQYAAEGKETVEPNTPEMEAFLKAHAELWKAEVEVVGLKPLTEVDLDLDKNTIPPTVLASLYPVFQ